MNKDILKIINEGASFTDDGLRCNDCGSVNNYEIIGLCDSTNGYGKVMKCRNCGNRVVQRFEFPIKERTYKFAGRNLKME